MEEEELSLARLLDALDWRVVLLGIGVVFSLDIVPGILCVEQKQSLISGQTRMVLNCSS